jgi:hypothetical protein
MQHKNAKVIEAFLQGNAIRHKNPLTFNWVIFKPKNPLVNPISYPDFTWEICECAIQEAASEYEKNTKMTTLECFAFRAGWMALGNYLTKNNLIDVENLPKTWGKTKKI